MGLGESKEYIKELTLFSPEERDILKENFTKLSRNEKNADRQLVENEILGLFGGPGEEKLASRICDLMTGQIAGLKTVTFEGYIHSAAIMVKGLLEDKAEQVVYLASGKKHQGTYENFLQFTKHVTCICFGLMLKERNVRSWDGRFTHSIDDESISRLGEALTRDLAFDGHSSRENIGQSIDFNCVFTHAAVCSWMLRCSQLTDFLSFFAHHIFHLPNESKSFIPLCRGIPSRVYPSWLTLADLFFINTSLPSDLRSEWRFLFSTRIHGESFSSLLGAIQDKGPSIIVIKDTEGHIFGGFASTSWTINAHYTGTDKNFMFSLSPHMAIYSTTGYNDHYQYLNIQQQTFPNGLGMGGQLEYFGLWIDAEYGKGKCSPTCTTYGCPQLSGSPNFTIDRLEVWGVGPEPVEDEESQPRPSILDADMEGKAMLKMLNRGPVSEGLRENPTADVPEEKELPPLC